MSATDLDELAEKLEAKLSRRSFRGWHLLVAAALSLAGGGGAGTFTANAQLDSRLRTAETKATELGAKVEALDDKVEAVQKSAEVLGEKLHQVDKKLDTATTILERVERRVVHMEEDGDR